MTASGPEVVSRLTEGKGQKAETMGATAPPSGKLTVTVRQVKHNREGYLPSAKRSHFGHLPNRPPHPKAGVASGY